MIYNKIKWVLAVLLIFFLILATNFIDKNNFNRVKDSIVIIYEDRLLAKGIVFDLSLLINEKYVANKTQDESFYDVKNKVVNSRVKELITEFGKTKLIIDEEKVFLNLVKNIEELEVLEKDYVKNEEGINSELNEIKTNLIQLSAIQLKEGKRQMFIGKDAVDSVELLTHIEVYCLILLAIIIQVIIFSGFKKSKK